MKKINKNMKVPDIIDGICELEGFIEHLEDTLKNRWHPDVRKRAKSDLTDARKKLTRLKNLLNEANSA